MIKQRRTTHNAKQLSTIHKRIDYVIFKENKGSTIHVIMLKVILFLMHYLLVSP